MDVFGVLDAISKRKDEFLRTGLNERKAMVKAMNAVSGEYHIPLLDVRKIVG
ncbi:Uncharacterised protein [uncultured archaeon]|nr:Uncharacterised protein [uncultured archaeon]